MNPELSALPPALFLMGPTCAGKTALALTLRERLPVELINVDSALVYRDLVIGAARPSERELARAPHRLLGFRDLTEPYSAAHFREDALREMADIFAAGRVPLLVGGTMLYFRTLLEGLAPLPQADPVLRARLEAEAAEQGWPHLHARLAAVDPVTAARLSPHDRQRLQRALEVYLVTGVTLSEHHARQRREAEAAGGKGRAFPYNVLQLAVAPADRAVLHARIAERFRQMLEQGLVDEVRALRQRPGVHGDLPAMRSVGYRQVWEFLEGVGDAEALLHRGIVATRQLAKRQFTWLRRWESLHWLDSDDAGAADTVVALWHRARAADGAARCDGDHGR